ncbi:MAG: ABC transporter permease [Spirochaetes bacterium]|nr:MAG: ABC transporter permease [Spirochaetota bacterium]
MIRVRTKKVMRDMLKNAPRAVLVILAIAVGIVAAGTVMIAYSVLTREMDSSYRMTAPASSAVATDTDARRLRAVVETVDGVETAEPRGIYLGRIAVGKDEWKPIILFAIDDFQDMRLNIVRPEKGSWPPRKGEMLIERAALPVARAALADQVEIEIPGVRTVRLSVAGIVHDAGQAPAWMEGMVYGYITRETLAMFGIDSLNRLLFSTRSDHDHDSDTHETGDARARVRGTGPEAAHLSSLEHINADVVVALAGQGVVARLVAPHAHDAGSVPRKGAHPHEGQMKSLLFLLGAFGSLAFALSGFSVFTLMSSLLAREVRAIGIMKAVGARTADIGRMYFLGVFVLACIALLPAIPLAYLLAGKYAFFAAGMLNFNIMNPLPSGALVSAIVLMGLAFPLAAASVPVLRGMRLKVRDAMCDYGVKVTAPARRAGRRSSAGTRWGAHLVLPLSNIVRARTRTSLTVVMLAAGGVLFMAALNTGSSIKATLGEIDRTLKYDVEVRLARPLPVEEINRVFLREGVTAIEAWSDTTGCRVMESGVQEREFRVLAVPPASAMIDLPLVSGRWFGEGDGNAIVVNQRWLAAERGVAVGDAITLRIDGRDLRVTLIGAVRMFGQSTALVPGGMIGQFSMRGFANSVRISSIMDPRDLMRSVNAAARESGIPVAMMFGRSDFKKALEDHFLIIVSFLVFMASFVVAVGAIGLSSTMSVSVLERYREIGIMRAIGGSNGRIVGIILVEGGIVGIAGFLLAVAVSFPVSMAIGSGFIQIFLQTSIDFAFEPLSIPLWFLVLTAVTLLASVLPARKAIRLSVRDALAYE